MRIDLPKDQWAELMDVDDMPASARRDVKAVLGIEIDDGKPHVAMNGALPDEMKAALIASVVTAWSFDKPITVEGVWAIPLTAYSKLVEAVEAHEAALNFDQESEKPGSENSSG